MSDENLRTIDGVEYSPIFVIDGKRYYSRAFVVLGDQADFLAAVWKHQGEGHPWRFVYRFRYYRDNVLSYESDDVKRTGEAQIPSTMTKAELLRTVRRAIQRALVEHGFSPEGELHELVLETSDARTIQRIMKREKFFHQSFLKVEQRR